MIGNGARYHHDAQRAAAPPLALARGQPPRPDRALIGDHNRHHPHGAPAAGVGRARAHACEQSTSVSADACSVPTAAADDAAAARAAPAPGWAAAQHPRPRTCQRIVRRGRCGPLLPLPLRCGG
eukprot:scaffold3366_cov365-Prasinococcus_capsulatus_cf.AAC.12